MRTAWRAWVTNIEASTSARSRFEQAEQVLAAHDSKQESQPAARYAVVDTGVAGSCHFALVLWALGDVCRARDLIEKALSDASARGHIQTLVYALGTYSIFERNRLDPARATVHATAQFDLAREHGLPFWLPGGHMTCGWARWRAGEREAGEAEMHRGEALRREQGLSMLGPHFAIMIADVNIRSGRHESALRGLDDMLSVNQQTHQFAYDAELHRHRGVALLGLSPQDPSTAEAALARAISVARLQQTRAFELRASLDLARLYCGTHREGEARDLLAAALLGFTDTPELPEIAEARGLRASLG